MSKIRITTFNKHPLPEELYLEIKEDRLVEMSTEFRNGPKEKHTGPIRIEVLLESTLEVDSFITYLNQLAKDLPIPQKAQRANAKTKEEPMRKDSVQELITYLKTNVKIKTQEDVIEYLRSLNFVLLTMDHWADIINSGPGSYAEKGFEVNVKEKHMRYQVLVKQLRVAKDPKNDKYDHNLFFLIKFIGNRTDRIHAYVDGEYKTTIKKDWKEVGEIGLKVKQKFYKFPAAMDYEERSKWRTEDRKAQANPEYEGTKFYYKWKPLVTILKLQPPKGEKK